MKHKSKKAKNTLQDLKSATIAIGLITKENPHPVAIVGSGFIADEDGYVVTASHVYQNCYKVLDDYKKAKEGNDAIPCAIMSFSKENITEMQFSQLDITGQIKLLDKAKSQKIDLDVAVCKLKGNKEKLPFLSIEEPKNLNMFDDVIMSGYPGGAASFNISSSVMGMYVSPVIQIGKISALIPDDLVRPAQGIITDIVGTGGSSGSPIVHRNNHKVVGIAQTVISSSVFLTQDMGKKSGITNIGLVTGVSNYILQGVPNVVKSLKVGKIKDVHVGLEYSRVGRVEFS